MMALVLLAQMSLAQAREIEKVNFPEQMDGIAGKNLVLNGVGLRVKRKLGMNFRVYVGGLYVVNKTTNAAEILANKEPRVIDLVFLRSLDADTLREAWQESYAKNCKDTCASTQASLKALNALMVNVKDGQHLKMTFTESGVEVGSNGHVDGADFSRNMLAVFIGENPPTPELKAGLLGP